LPFRRPAERGATPGPFAETPVHMIVPRVVRAEHAAQALRPVSRRSDYYTKPSIEMLASLSEDDLARVDNFEVGRFGYGKITWPGLTDLRGLDLDAIIDIEYKKVAVYPGNTAPPVGAGLNKTAVVELNVKAAKPGKVLKDPQKMIDRVREATIEAGHEFISYNLECWIFKVNHWS
jgi:nuclear pore complex protein Nup98-Nup96